METQYKDEEDDEEDIEASTDMNMSQIHQNPQLIHKKD